MLLFFFCFLCSCVLFFGTDAIKDMMSGEEDKYTIALCLIAITIGMYCTMRIVLIFN